MSTPTYPPFPYRPLVRPSRRPPPSRLPSRFRARLRRRADRPPKPCRPPRPPTETAARPARETAGCGGSCAVGSNGLGPNGPGDVRKAVALQQPDQPNLDPADQAGTFEHERRVELDEARSGADAGIGVLGRGDPADWWEEHTSEPQSRMHIWNAVLRLNNTT